MLGSEFLAIVGSATPDRDELDENGLDDDEIDAIQNTFSYTVRESQNQPAVSATELERMILDHDCSTIEIGMVRFLEWPESHPHGIAVAHCEADTIVVRTDGSVGLYDHAHPESVAMECAADSESFLRGLAAFVEVRTNRSEWRGRAESAADHCSTLAGGSAFTDFFAILCGFLQ